ncbi:MAG: flagellar export chaperone FlgN [Acidimicrobiia bacterium]|nr:flagellar export chaperone FlgN [Acidimicrobiia bacterium]
MSITRVDDRLSQLSQTLWRQRAQVEVLLYRLEVQQLVLASGRSRWIDMSSRDVEDAIDDLRTEELLRAAHVAAVAPALGCAPESSLSELADAAGEPWAQILREHQATFLTLIGNIEAVSRDNRDLLARGLNDTRAFVSRLADTPQVDGYSNEGAGTRAITRPTLVDWDV